MKPSEVSTTRTSNGDGEAMREMKPPFRPAKDDTKPLLQDPILRSDPIETEEAVLRLPPFPAIRPKSQSKCTFNAAAMSHLLNVVNGESDP